MSLETGERSGSLEINERPEAPDSDERSGISRRMLLRAGALGAGVAGLGAATGLLSPNLAGRGLWSPDGIFEGAAIAWADNIYTEVFPTSPLILNPFSEDLAPKLTEPLAKASDIDIAP